MSAVSTPWPGLLEAWPRARLIHFDRDIVVVDKPAGTSTHAPDEGHHDDVVSRLTRHFEALGEDRYLGIHQRLDRDTSGVLLLSRRREANKSLADQFEGRRIDKRYVAVVEGRVPDRAVLVHHLAPGPDGTRVAREAHGRPRPDEQEARTQLQRLERFGKRNLVELVPETGRTHQLRVQLAAIGAPIVGDTLYGGAPSERLCLHARALGLVHPSSGQRVHFEAPIPSELRRALTNDGTPRLPSGRAELTALIRAAADRRYGVMASGETDVCRIAHLDADGMPGLSIDLYGSYAVLSIYDELEREAIDAVAGAILDAGARGVYLKRRPKHASRIVDSRTDEVAPRLPLAGEAAPDPLEVHERGVPYEARLGDGLSTGLFLDQRDNRLRIRELAKGARMLNLFAYTGSFSVAAALGGAKSTTTVDVSRTVLAWAEKNLERSGFSGPAHTTIESDVFAFLERAKQRGEKWDLVVLDPPSFSTTKRSRFSAEDDYQKLAEATLAVCSPGAKLLACTNHRGIPMMKLRRKLHEAARAVGREVAQMRSLPPPSDFPAPPGSEPHLKCVLVTLAGASASKPSAAGRPSGRAGGPGKPGPSRERGGPSGAGARPQKGGLVSTSSKLTTEASLPGSRGKRSARTASTTQSRKRGSSG